MRKKPKVVPQHSAAPTTAKRPISGIEARFAKKIPSMPPPQGGWDAAYPVFSIRMLDFEGPFGWGSIESTKLPGELRGHLSWPKPLHSPLRERVDATLVRPSGTDAIGIARKSLDNVIRWKGMSSTVRPLQRNWLTHDGIHRDAFAMSREEIADLLGVKPYDVSIALFAADTIQVAVTRRVEHDSRAMWTIARSFGGDRYVYARSYGDKTMMTFPRFAN